MKKSLFFFLFSSVVVFTNAQLRKIPADVTEAFTSRYPHATRVEWRDKLQYFEADFQLNGYDITASFSSKGEWEGSERVLNFDDLPDEIKNGFSKSKFTDWQKKSVYEVQELGKPLQYRINVQKSGLHKKNLFFDTNGKLLKQSLSL